jgi:serine/threonine protein kinase
VVGDEEVWLVLEFVEGGSLYDLLAHSSGLLSWDLQLSFALQAAKAINYLHTSSPPVVHKDVKSANFLIKDKNKLLLTDCGLAYLTSGPDEAEQCSEKVDIYRLGSVFFEIVSKSGLKATANGSLSDIHDSCPRVSILLYVIFIMFLNLLNRNFLQSFKSVGTQIQINAQRHWSWLTCLKVLFLFLFLYFYFYFSILFYNFMLF